ncbi:putative ankyrin repeat-containing protein [Talaromyces proteolyticus]|uniref:Ankyrin repeat-containing protein n=1 Tax=Talaromyces proteolyticus TaxID=1131652 RepID=A0AAD4KUH7_9EURO|nr:putative ankyrin repeat-containing protein [Talaromyces proteolyticus]KAH8696299.1 putative ankyrin repeat-containing protein [Talaromyces proteolyticus]
MEEVLQSWASPIWAPDTMNYRKFFNASVSGDMQAIQEVLTSGEIDINACPDYMDWEGATALHQAAEHGHLELVRLLISHGAEIERRDHSPVGPKTALHIAAHNEHLAIVQELIQNGADVTTRGEMGGPLLNFVLWNIRSVSDKIYEIIDLVLSQGYDINSWYMDMGGTVLHQASEIGDLTLIRFLVDRGADCNYTAPTYEDYTVLHSAVTYKQIDACRLLIELGAQVTPSAFGQAFSMEMVELLHPHLSQSDISTSGILDHASVDFVRDLLARQIVNVNDVNLSGESALFGACIQRKSTAKLEVLLEFGADPHVRISRVVPGQIFKGDTPLHWAVLFTSSTGVTMLIQAGANLEARNEAGHTPLIRLAMSGPNEPRLEIFEVLVKEGVDVNAVDLEHNTALHHLAMQRMHIISSLENLVVFQLLMKAGALTNLVNSQGKTCLELFSSSAIFRESIDALYP